MNLTTPRRLAALAIPVALFLAACGDDSTSSGDSTTTSGAAADTVEAPAGLVSDGVITICSDTPYEPFEFQDADGKDVGYDIDLMAAVGARADLTVTVIDLPFDGILGSLAAGQCDVVASAVSIKPERQEQVDFTEPYFDSAQSLLAKKDSGIESIDDLAGKTVGVQSTTTGETYAKENAKDATVKSFEDATGLFAALESGDIDAILQDLPVNGYRSSQDDTVAVVESYGTDEQYGFAVEKGNTELLDFLNDGLQALRDDGTFDEIYAKYLGDSKG